MAIVGEAHIVVRAITSGFQKEVENALRDVKPVVKRVGEDVGRDFNRSVSRGMGRGGKSPFDRLQKEAEQARRSFNKLIKVGYLMGPAISGAVSAVGDLVMGLFSVGSAVGAAAPALAVLPGILVAIGQAALTAKLAFGGVAKAVGALLKQKTGKSTGGGNNDDAIADARRRLAQVYQQAAEKMAAANDKVRKAQVALNQAYEDGAESLQQLGFDAEDAAIAQEKAAIELERARETLLRVQDLPPDSRARREAELAFKQADLDYRQAADRSNDLAKAQEYAAQTGIEGTKEVQSAKEDLAQAEADLFKTQRDNAQDILEAQLALQRAMQKTNQGASSSVDLLKDLSEEARRFALYIATLKPVFLDLRAAAGRQLFGPLTNAMSTLVSDFVPVLLPILENMGRVVGQLALRFVQMLTSVRNLNIFERVFGGANIIVMRNIGYAVVDLFEAFLNILDAVSPLTIQFSEYIRLTASSLNNTIKFKNATGELAKSFERAAEFAKSIGGLFGSAFGAFKSLGSGASDAGKKIIDAFAGAFDKLKAFADEGNRTGELAVKFNAIADNIIAIGGFLGEVMKMFYQISGNKGVKAFFDAIKPIPDIFVDIFNKMTSTGPVFGELLVNIALLLKAFTDTGGVQMFFSIINKAAQVLVAVFSNEIVQKAFFFLAAIKGITLAFGVLATVSRFAFLGILGNLIAMVPATGAATVGISGLRVAIYRKVIALRASNAASAGFLTAMKSKIKEIPKLVGALRMLGTAWLTATWPILLVVAAIAIVAGAFYMMYKNSEDLRKAVSELGKALKEQLLKSWETIKGALERIIPSIGNVSGMFKTMGDWVAKYVMPPLQILLTFIMKLATFFIVTFIGNLTLFINYIRGFVGLFVGLFQAIRTGSFDPLEKAFEDFVNGMIDGVNTLIDAFNVLNPFADIPYVEYIGDAKTATDALKASTVPLTDSQEAVQRKMQETAETAATLYTNFGSLADIQGKLNNESANAYDRITKQGRAYIDTGARATELANVHKSLADTLKTGDLDRKQQIQTMNDFAGKIHDAAKESLALGGSSADAAKIVADGRQTFVDQAKALGFGADEAERMANKVALTPETIKKNFAVNGIDKLKDLTKELADLETLAGSANARESRGAAAFAAEKIIKIKAELATKLSVVFKKGTATDPLYVKASDGSFARGGRVGGGDTILVGEKGPELFVPGSDGSVIPNNKLASIGVSGSSPVVNVYPSQGMDEVEVAHIVSRQLAWTMRRGA